MLRRLYDWVIHWAETPYGAPALFVMAFAESSFFPIPPDVLLIALCLGAPRKSFRFALICTVGSVLGGLFGYWIGVQFLDIIGYRILDFYGALDKFRLVQDMYNRYDVLFVGAAGFTPIPYKVFTIAAGAFHMDIMRFAVASALSRGARFFILSIMLWKFGERIKTVIDKYFNVLSILFFIILVAGFILVKYVIG